MQTIFPLGKNIHITHVILSKAADLVIEFKLANGIANPKSKI